MTAGDEAIDALIDDTGTADRNELTLAQPAYPTRDQARSPIPGGDRLREERRGPPQLGKAQHFRQIPDLRTGTGRHAGPGAVAALVVAIQRLRHRGPSRDRQLGRLVQP